MGTVREILAGLPARAYAPLPRATTECIDLPYNPAGMSCAELANGKRSALARALSSGVHQRRLVRPCIWCLRSTALTTRHRSK